MPVRSAKPDLSVPAQNAYKAYEHYLTTELDLRLATVRNYLSDVQQFMAWFEKQHDQSFALDAVATPTLTTYRDYLKHDLQRKPATINRYLVSLKRYFSCPCPLNLYQQKLYSNLLSYSIQLLGSNI